jgi:hypothetical protein
VSNATKVSGSDPLSLIQILINGALTLKVFSDELRGWEFIEGGYRPNR